MAHVQTTAAIGHGVVSITTGAIVSTPGNLISVGASTFTGGGVSLTNFQDSKTNTYNQPASSPSAGNLDPEKVWFARAESIVGGSGHTVTANFSAGENVVIVASEFSGRAASGALDKDNSSAEGSNTTSHSGPSVTTTADGEDIVCYAVDTTGGAGQGFTAGSGWTIPTNGSQVDGTNQAFLMQYQENKAAGTYTATDSTTNSTTQAFGIMSFKPPTPVVAVALHDPEWFTMEPVTNPLNVSVWN